MSHMYDMNIIIRTNYNGEGESESPGRRVSYPVYFRGLSASGANLYALRASFLFDRAHGRKLAVPENIVTHPIFKRFNDLNTDLEFAHTWAAYCTMGFLYWIREQQLKKIIRLTHGKVSEKDINFLMEYVRVYGSHDQDNTDAIRNIQEQQYSRAEDTLYRIHQDQMHKIEGMTLGFYSVCAKPSDRADFFWEAFLEEIDKMADVGGRKLLSQYKRDARNKCVGYYDVGERFLPLIAFSGCVDCEDSDLIEKITGSNKYISKSENFRVLIREIAGTMRAELAILNKEVLIPRKMLTIGEYIQSGLAVCREDVSCCERKLLSVKQCTGTIYVLFEPCDLCTCVIEHWTSCGNQIKVIPFYKQKLEKHA